MYRLYNSPGACPLATQVILHKLEQAVEVIDVKHITNFAEINPVETVPVLFDGDNKLTEGAAIILYLLDKHENDMLPTSGIERQQAIQKIMFANATMHPAYGRLFFIAENLNNEDAKKTAFEAAENAISNLWQVVEQQLETHPYLGGDKPSASDILLAVYSRWGQYFPVNIKIGKNTVKMLDAVQAMPEFQRAVDAEIAQSVA